ncbi:MAG TPA: MotA/TolQ/ExbB proton channel family protein [Bacteroidota bacterium]|nr:MotA/TolQ/ExbB proton channel family protein [Bacteroidota bacterium]
MNLLELFLKGGIVMWPIFLCSLLAVAIIFERFFVLSRAKFDAKPLMLKLRSALSRNDIVGALNACSQSNATVPTVLRKGVASIESGPEAVRSTIESAGKEEVNRLENHLGILANIAGIGPMLGFLGTVVGMINAFRTIEMLGGNVNSGNLAGGIWEAMLSSAFGLVVGIPALGFYNYFVGRVSQITFSLEAATDEFLGYMKPNAHPAAEPAPHAGGKDQRAKRVFSEEDEFFEPKD